MGISKDPAISIQFGKKLPSDSDSYEKILETITGGVRADTKKKGKKEPTTAAFGNARGDWYEVLVATALWNYGVESGEYLCFLLPNKTALPFQNLFGGRSALALEDLFRVLRRKNVVLLASNPDILVVAPPKALFKAGAKRIERLDQSGVDFLRSAYKFIEGKCEYNWILAGAGVKTSNRPDRRLQLVQEGSVLKAIATHFQTRFWDPDYRVRYVAANLNVSEADREALRTAATHTLVSVNMTVEPAVDALIEVKSPLDIRKLLKAALGR